MATHLCGCWRLPGERPCQAWLFPQVLSLCCALFEHRALFPVNTMRFEEYRQSVPYLHDEVSLLFFNHYHDDGEWAYIQEEFAFTVHTVSSYKAAAPPCK